MFFIGDIVFYPVFGAGLIINIEDKYIHGNITKYYMIRLVKNDMTVMIPVLDGDKKLRLGISKEDIEGIYNILKDKPDILPPKWLDRYKLYNDCIRKGDILELTGLLRNIYYFSKEKKLSRSERNICDNILEMISGELSLVQGVNINEIKEKILKILA